MGTCYRGASLALVFTPGASPGAFRVEVVEIGLKERFASLAIVPTPGASPGASPRESCFLDRDHQERKAKKTPPSRP
jgi:hypothetical protein